jgi:hypothetical protein
MLFLEQDVVYYEIAHINRIGREFFFPFLFCIVYIYIYIYIYIGKVKLSL